MRAKNILKSCTYYGMEGGFYVLLVFNFHKIEGFNINIY